MSTAFMPTTTVVDCCCGVDHAKTAWQTETPGLVVNRDGCVDKPERDVWNITHHLTGLRLPASFESPEAAMRRAALLAGIGDWTALHPQADRRAFIARVSGCGADARVGHPGRQVQRNEPAS